MKTFSVTFFHPHPNPAIRHYPLAVRSEVDAVSRDDAADTIIARHTDNRGNTPKVQAIVERNPQRPLPHSV